LYLLVDDAYWVVMFDGRLRQRGPEPKLSDIEVLTMEIFGEQQGRHTMETAIAKLSERFAAQTTKARNLRSFVNRMARKLLADNFSQRAAQS
jgi:hypothetical protein